MMKPNNRLNSKLHTGKLRPGIKKFAKDVVGGAKIVGSAVKKKLKK